MKTKIFVFCLLSFFSLLGCQEAPSTGSDTLSVIEPGVICNLKQNLCFDQYGVSLGLTEEFIHAEAAKQYLDDKAPNWLNGDQGFGISAQLFCNTHTRQCIDRDSQAINEELTAGLFIDHISEPKLADSKELIGKSWYWQSTQMNNDETWQPAHPKQFGITFISDQKVDVIIDCNRGSGGVELSDHSINFGLMSTTMMLCPGNSPDQQFLKDLGQVNSWFIYEDKLIMELPYDSGSMIFAQ